MSTRPTLLACAAALTLAACAPLDGARQAALGLIPGAAAPRTVALATPPAPARRPAAPLNADFRARDLLNGGIIAFNATRRGDSVTVTQSDGCVWTRRSDWFAPSAAWSGCDDGVWSKGRAQVRAKGSIWPLRQGAEGAFSRTATAQDGRSYRRDTACRVTGAEAVVRENGARTPAWVVACADGKRTRTTWWAPGEGPVAFRKVHADDGVEEAWVRL